MKFYLEQQVKIKEDGKHLSGKIGVVINYYKGYDYPYRLLVIDESQSSGYAIYNYAEEELENIFKEG